MSAEPPQTPPSPRAEDQAAEKSAGAPDDIPNQREVSRLSTPPDTPVLQDNTELPDTSESIARSRARIYEEAGRMLAEAMRKLAEAEKLV